MVWRPCLVFSNFTKLHFTGGPAGGEESPGLLIPGRPSSPPPPGTNPTTIQFYIIIANSGEPEGAEGGHPGPGRVAEA